MKPRRIWASACVTALTLSGITAVTRDAASSSGAMAPADKWAASWAASAHGPYPSGNPSAQPDLSAAFENAEAVDQTFRLIVKPDLWGTSARLRFTNVFGSRAVTLDDVYVGLQSTGGNVAAGHELAGPLSRPGQHHDCRREPRAQRRGRFDLREKPGRSAPRRPQARGQLPRRRLERTDDMARQGAANVVS